MINVVPCAATCATGWLAAAQRLIRENDQAYNLIVDIDNPSNHTARDVATILEVDQFLQNHGANPVVTVANTIFPNELARWASGQQLRKAYLDRYDKLGKSWGRYFERLVRWPVDGSDQLHDMIERLRTQAAGRSTFHNIYELAIFNPSTDSHLIMNRQCLSFLSFKLHPTRGLTLTAVYRNHYYVTRALGNFVGLGNLMKYVAAQAGLKVGPLTCISTHAEIDTSSRRRDGDEDCDKITPWTIRDARGLIESASRAADVCPSNS